MKKKIVVLGIVFSLLLTGCNLSTKKLADEVVSNLEKATETAKPEETEAAEVNKEEKSLSLGDKATLNDWKITVKKAEIKAKITRAKYYVYKPSKGSKFICISAAVRNNGEKEDTFLPRIGYADKAVTAKLIYKDKYEYTPTQLLSYKKDITNTKIEPLKTKKGVFVFDIPKKVAKKKSKLALELAIGEEKAIYTLK